jgi:orotidine-5'-phosphate decarboxylase
MKPKLICLALDVMSIAGAMSLAHQLGKDCCAVKIHHLYDEERSSILHLSDGGKVPVWVDCKLHDIPKTVALRTKAVVRSGAKIVSVHGQEGPTMIKAAVEAAGENAAIWVITVLTSVSAKEFAEKNRGMSLREAVLERALWAKEAGADGVVCATPEVQMLATYPSLQGMKIIVPGTDPSGKPHGEHKRSGTPEQAILDGATSLVVGERITKSVNPIATFHALNKKLLAAQSSFTKRR